MVCIDGVCLDRIDGTIVKVRLVDESFLADDVRGGLPPDAADGGAQAEVDAENDDVRTLSVKYGGDGGRRRRYRESTEEMSEGDFPDWPIDGPRTCQWVVREIGRTAEGPREQPALWVRNARIPDGDRAIYEDLVLALILETAVCYDCLNVVNLASMEILCRKRQLLAEAHAANPAAPSYEGGDYFLGTGLRAGGAIVAPSLSAFVSDKLKADAAILKEKRKLAEARNLRPTTAPKQKGGGKGAEAEK